MSKYRIIKETNRYNEEYYIIQKKGTLWGWNNCGHNGDTWKTYEMEHHYKTLEEAEERFKVFTTPHITKQEVINLDRPKLYTFKDIKEEDKEYFTKMIEFLWKTKFEYLPYSNYTIIIDKHFGNSYTIEEFEYYLAKKFLDEYNLWKEI